MASSTFEKLARQLSDEERLMMLNQVRDILPAEQQPLVGDTFEIEPVDLEKAFQECPWYEKLFMKIIQLFTGKDISSLMEARKLKQLAKKVRREGAGYLDLENNRVTQNYMELMQSLKANIQPLKDSLDRIRGEKEEFIVFFGNRFFKDFSQQLLAVTDPEMISKKNNELRLIRVKDDMQNAFDSAFNSISEVQKKRFKMEARTVHQLNALAEYPFFNMIGAFSEQGVSGQEAPFEDIRNPQMSMLNILYSLKMFPDADLLENLFLFGMREQFSDSSAEVMSKWMGELYRKAMLLKDVLEQLDGLPIVEITKLITGEINYMPLDIGGGEDFFHIYRRYWLQQVDYRYNVFVSKCKINELKNNLLSTWGFVELKPVGRYNHRFSEHCQFRYVVTMGLLLNFINELKVEKNYPLLDIIWKRGEFYKKENRKDFNDVMEFLQTVDDQIDRFIEKLADQGYYASALADILRESDTFEDSQKRDIVMLYKAIDMEVHEIIKKSLVYIDKLGHLLTGILMGDKGEYDTLSNYSDLAGPPNRMFKDELVTREFLVNNARRNLQDIFALEEKAPF